MNEKSKLFHYFLIKYTKYKISREFFSGCNLYKLNEMLKLFHYSLWEWRNYKISTPNLSHPKDLAGKFCISFLLHEITLLFHNFMLKYTKNETLPSFPGSVFFLNWMKKQNYFIIIWLNKQNTKLSTKSWVRFRLGPFHSPLG